MAEVAFDVAAAIAFARRFGLPNVMTFASGRTLHPNMPTTAQAESWLYQHAGCDIYFAPAHVRDGFVGKPKKSDCLGSHWAWVDIDPPKGMTDLEELAEWQARTLAETAHSDLPRAQVIVDSGRGLWLYWRLPRQLPTAEIESINYAVAQQLAGGDACYNIDRVARLPYTLNTKTGRYACVLRDEEGTTPIEALPTAVLSTTSDWDELGDLGQPCPPQTEDAFRALVSAVPCRSDRRDALVLAALDPAASRDLRGSSVNLSDRSAVMFSWAVRAIMAGMEPRVVRDCILSPAVPAISGHLLDSAKVQPSSRARAAGRQVARAMAFAREQGWSPSGEDDDFQRDSKNQITKTQHNIRVALRRLGVALSYDTFQDRLQIVGLQDFGPHLDDAAVRRLWLLIEDRFGFLPGKEYFWNVIEDTARQKRFHPVRDYLDTLQWDGVPRIDRWLSEYGGADDTPYTRAIGRLMLVAAVRRIREPGCKFDEMVVFESAQGTNKSSALAVMSVRDDWFTDDLPLDRDTKVIIERLAGKWIVEAAELKGSRKAEVEHIKAFLSRRHDKARMAYARMPVEVPRQCVIVGSTNSEQYLRDATGNRRFWPVRIKQFDLAALRCDRDQLWAEAVDAEASGEAIRLAPELWPLAAAQQEQRRVEDPYVDTLAKALGDQTGKLRAADVWAILDIPVGQRNQSHSERMGEAMRLLGWERTKLRFGSGPEWAYVRGEPDERQKRVRVVAEFEERSQGVRGTPF